MIWRILHCIYRITYSQIKTNDHTCFLNISTTSLLRHKKNNLSLSWAQSNLETTTRIVTEVIIDFSKNRKHLCELAVYDDRPNSTSFSKHWLYSWKPQYCQAVVLLPQHRWRFLELAELDLAWITGKKWLVFGLCIREDMKVIWLRENNRATHVTYTVLWRKIGPPLKNPNRWKIALDPQLTPRTLMHLRGEFMSLLVNLEIYVLLILYSRFQIIRLCKMMWAQIFIHLDLE